MHEFETTLDLLKSIDHIYPTVGLKCDGCNLGQNYYSDGYRFIRSGLFFHKECTSSNMKICNVYHPQHSLHVKVVSENENKDGQCRICRGNLPKLYYYCLICNFAIDLICAKKEVKMKIEGSKTHTHPLSLVPKMIIFTCHLCGLPDDRFPYACNLCDLNFHKDCGESTHEINYSCHPKHFLKRLTQVPSYTDGKCCMCGNKLHNVFYHCSICNFSVDVDCARNPPPFTLLNLKVHEHSLNLMPQRNFVCNACGMDDDPNPYVCSQCNFMVHRNCIDIPRVIKVNRHAHRIFYNYCLDAGDWKCGVCHKEINWTCGAYSCSACHDFSIHLRCATRFGIWDGIDLEGISENTLEIKSYEVIEAGVIKHFSHEDHTLKLKEENDEANDLCMLCKACIYPILSSPFYSCMECNDFIIHQKCAYLPKRKKDSLYKMWITLNKTYEDEERICGACHIISNGFKYISDNGLITMDVRCGSIPEPFIHESHPLHSLYINYSTEDKICIACGDKKTMVLICEECEFVLDIKCSTLPKLVKHQNDKEHFLSLCYGEKTKEQYWCEICEEKLNPEKWFYSCNHCGTTFHIKCTIGDLIWIKPQKKDDSYIHLTLNNRLTRPICVSCHSRCQFESFLNLYEGIMCSIECLHKYV
ncbi:Protein VACUOLELESS GAMETOPHYTES [Cardamine amara subsp. amara]|uniref:Protein VACUOLELESS GAMETOPHYTES n=1 Tax=Cardamine amara subsp. amara TaxID=228776 RepID=A0ABD1B500_CARAN